MIDPITVLRAAEAGLPAAESHPNPPLACFPLRTDWEQARMRERHPDGVPYEYRNTPEKYREQLEEFLQGREEFPAPQRTSRDPEEVRLLPASVLALAEYAREQSWEVRTQYGQGNVPHGTTGKPGALKELHALRFGAHPMTDRQAYAIYSRSLSAGTWTWSSVCIWGPDLPPYMECGVTELKEFLRDPARPTESMLAWIGVVRDRREQAEAEKKIRDAFRKKYAGVALKRVEHSWPGALLNAAFLRSELINAAAGTYADDQIAEIIGKPKGRSTKEGLS